MDLIAQVAIFVFGLSAVALVGVRQHKMRRWGYVLGLISQPFWFYTLTVNHQYVLLAAAVVYTMSWINGIKNHWRLADKKGEE